MKDVLLLERDDLAQGTSAAGGGFVALWAAGHIAVGPEQLEMEQYALRFYATLAEQVDFNFQANGMLWLALTDAGWRSHFDVLSTHPGVPDKQILTGAEVSARTGGLVDGSQVFRGVYHPHGAQLTAALAVHAVASAFIADGGRIERHRPVTRILVDQHHLTGVEVGRGEVRSADAVVLACGAWTNELLRPLGFFVPMAPLIASRLISNPLSIPAGIPGIHVPELAGLWIRPEEGRLLWGRGYDTSPRYSLLDREAVPSVVRQEWVP